MRAVRGDMDDARRGDVRDVDPSPVAEGERRFQSGRVLTISVGHAVHDTYTGFLAPLLPAFITNLAITKTEAGLLSVFVQGPSLLQPFIGHLADRRSLRFAVILTPAVTAVMMSLLGVAPSYGVLAMLLVVTGFSSATLHSVGPVMAGRLSGRSLGRGMGFWMVGGELGRTLGPVVVVSAMRFLGLQGTPWLMLGGIGASAVLYSRLRDVPGHRPPAGGDRPWRKALHTMRPLMVPLIGLITARAFLLSAITLYLPTFLSEEGSSLWMAGASLSVLEAAGMVGALTGGSISDRLGRLRVLLVSMLSTGLLVFIFLAASGWQRLPLLILIGFSALAVTPVVMALVQESVPENRALANGIYMSLSFGIRSVAVLVLGALGDLFGLRVAFATSAVLVLLGLPVLLLLPRRAPRRGSQGAG